MVPILRETLSLGVDRVRLVVPEGETVSPDSTARALAAVLRERPGYDLILGGGSSGGPEGVLARLTAEAVGVAFAGTAAQVSVRATDSESVVLLTGADGRQPRARALPAGPAVQAAAPLRAFTMQ